MEVKINEFIREMKKERESTSTEKEIFKLANHIYDTMHKGETRKAARRTIIRLVEAINPELSATEKILCGICIESLIPAFFAEFLATGTIIHIKERK